MIVAIVPAGGQSRRMGQPKLQMPFGSGTVLEATLAAVRLGGIDEMLVVAAQSLSTVVETAQRAGAMVAILPHATPDMRQTVEFGLAWWRKRHQPGPDDAWLLMPADHPTISPRVIATLVQARQHHGNKSIWVPTYQGKRGHPPLFAWSHADTLRAFPADKGINAYIRGHAEAVLEVESDDPELLADLDTPADYERLVRRWPTDPV